MCRKRSVTVFFGSVFCSLVSLTLVQGQDDKSVGFDAESLLETSNATDSLNNNATGNGTDGRPEEIRGRFLGGGMNPIYAGGYGSGQELNGLYPGGNGIIPGGPGGPDAFGSGVGYGAGGLLNGPGQLPGETNGRFNQFLPPFGQGSNSDFVVEQFQLLCRAFAPPGVPPVIQWSVDSPRSQPYLIAVGPEIYGNQRGAHVDFRPEVPGIWVSRLTLSKPTVYDNPYDPAKTYICSVVIPGRPPLIVGFAGLSTSQSNVGQPFGGGIGGPFGGIGYGDDVLFRSKGGSASNQIGMGAGGVQSGMSGSRPIAGNMAGIKG
ncbi:unnamed protein product [Notodromas monacha]|uniref:Uncharacterized protein n=1 Tax=Notodromas monacha TaxID=399045 RepID=A0A7R9GIC6_9CRUS|nr:unnamed protein product [Notodromas monacha]CAG0921634.1 unnamed protein product [Notodromas monacha]